jgi:hypothetical protein
LFRFRLFGGLVVQVQPLEQVVHTAFICRGACWPSWTKRSPCGGNGAAIASTGRTGRQLQGFFCYR